MHTLTLTTYLYWRQPTLTICIILTHFKWHIHLIIIIIRHTTDEGIFHTSLRGSENPKKRHRHIQPKIWQKEYHCFLCATSKQLSSVYIWHSFNKDHHRHSLLFCFFFFLKYRNQITYIHFGIISMCDVTILFHYYYFESDSKVILGFLRVERAKDPNKTKSPIERNANNIVHLNTLSIQQGWIWFIFCVLVSFQIPSIVPIWHGILVSRFLLFRDFFLCCFLCNFAFSLILCEPGRWKGTEKNEK